MRPLPPRTQRIIDQLSGRGGQYYRAGAIAFRVHGKQLAQGYEPGSTAYLHLMQTFNTNWERDEDLLSRLGR